MLRPLQSCLCSAGRWRRGGICCVFIVFSPPCSAEADGSEAQMDTMFSERVRRKPSSPSSILPSHVFSCTSAKSANFAQNFPEGSGGRSSQGKPREIPNGARSTDKHPWYHGCRRQKWGEGDLELLSPSFRRWEDLRNKKPIGRNETGQQQKPVLERRVALVP